MERLRAAVIGTGFIGAAHIEALKRLPGVDVVALVELFDAQRKADELDVPKGYEDYRKMIEECGPDCIHICTPNHTHREIALFAIEHGVNVICEKPMATSAKEAQEMVEAAEKSGLVCALNFHNRFYPIPYRMRNMVRGGELGDIFHIQGGYLQDWLLYDTDFSWKVIAEKCGRTRATSDLGSHWMDLAEYVSGQRIKEVFAEFKTVYPFRKNSTPEGVKEVAVDTEDFSCILLRFDGGAVGMASFSAVFAGKKNQTVLQVAGTKASLEWDNEKVNDVLIGQRDTANGYLTKDPSLVDPDTASVISYPGGHAEGFPDAFKQNFRAIYDAIRGIKPANPFAVFADGAHMMRICDALYESARSGRWIPVD